MNIGIASMIVVIGDIVEFIKKAQNLPLEKLPPISLANSVKPYLAFITQYLNRLSWDEIKVMRSFFGSGGVEKVRRQFQKSIYDNESNFEPEGLQQWIVDNSGNYNTETSEMIDAIQTRVKDYIFTNLKQQFGDQDNKWWTVGINKEIQKACSIKSIEEGSVEPLENFLLTLDYQRIVKDQWSLLGNVFTPPDKKHANKDDKISWFVKLNGIRNRVKHPERSKVTEDEYHFVKSLKDWLLNNMTT